MKAIDRLEEAPDHHHGNVRREQRLRPPALAPSTAYEQSPPIRAGDRPSFVGSRSQRRTLRMRGKFADIGRWFAIGLDVLRQDSYLRPLLEGSIRTPPRSDHSGRQSYVIPTEARGPGPSCRSFTERRARSPPARPSRSSTFLGQYIGHSFTGSTFDDGMPRTQARRHGRRAPPGGSGQSPPADPRDGTGSRRRRCVLASPTLVALIAAACAGAASPSVPSPRRKRHRLSTPSAVAAALSQARRKIRSPSRVISRAYFDASPSLHPRSCCMATVSARGRTILPDGSGGDADQTVYVYQSDDRQRRRPVSTRPTPVPTRQVQHRTIWPTSRP